MAPRHGTSSCRLTVEALEERLVPPVPPWPVEAFDQTAVGALPANWVQWSNTGSNRFAVSSTRFVSPSNSLAVDAPLSNTAARAWLNDQLPADAQASATIFLDSLIPAQVLLRGQQLATTT